MISVTLKGYDGVAARYASFRARMSQRLAGTMSSLGLALQDRVAANLGGAVLQRRTGRLAAAQTMQLAQQDDSVSVSVGFDADAVPYGAINEFGGTTRAHLIAAKRAAALAFPLGARLVFAKRVQHPGSTIPARSFLRAALAEMAADGASEVDGAVMDELGA